MGLSNAGRDFIAAAIMNDGPPTFFTNANAYLGVGNSSAAFDKAHTDLQGASKDRQPMDSTYPQRTNNVLTFKATWGNGEGEFAWEEWGTFNAAAAGTMLNRAVSAMGTKTAGATWVLTATVTVNNP